MSDVIMSLGLSFLAFAIGKWVLDGRSSEIKWEIKKHQFHGEPVPGSLIRKKLFIDLGRWMFGAALVVTLVLIGIALP